MIDSTKVMTLIVAIIMLGVGVFAFFVTTTGIDNSGYDYRGETTFTFDAEVALTADDPSLNVPWDTNFATTRAKAAATGSSSKLRMSAGYLETFNRSYLYFDTSSLSDTCIVKTVSLQLYGDGDTGTGTVVVIGDITNTKPSFPTVNGDFDVTHYTTQYVNNFTTTDLTWNTIPFTDVTGISLTGTTGMALLISDDYWNVNGTTDYLEFDDPDEANNPTLTIGIEYTRDMTNVPEIGGNVFNIVGVVLLVSAIMSIVFIVTKYI